MSSRMFNPFCMCAYFLAYILKQYMYVSYVYIMCIYIYVKSMCM